jgi:hypothetical protein
MDDISSIGEPVDGPGPRRQFPEDLRRKPGPKNVVRKALIPANSVNYTVIDRDMVPEGTREPEPSIRRFSDGTIRRKDILAETQTSTCKGAGRLG